jgi:hypothetical protein
MRRSQREIEKKGRGRKGERRHMEKGKRKREIGGKVHEIGRQNK